jgi:hypothetical protein
MAGVYKDTGFGEISKRELYIIKLYLQNRIEFLEGLVRRAKRIAESWDDPESSPALEELMWDICIFFEDCAVCPAEFACRKKKDICTAQK